MALFNMRLTLNCKIRSKFLVALTGAWTFLGIRSGHRIRLFLVVLALMAGLGTVVPLGLLAQGGSAVPSRNLEVCTNKTSMLVFPVAVQSADRGAAYILAERVPGAENVLKVKAAKPGFAPSNLTVITKDGRLYSFIVCYNAKPACLVLDFKDSLGAYDDPAGSGPVRFKGEHLHTDEVIRIMNQIRFDPPFIRRTQINKDGLSFKLEGVYFKKDILFFKFRLLNNAGIPFDLASLRLFIRDKKIAKRTAIRDNELQVMRRMTWGQPELGANTNVSETNKDSGETIIVAVPRFTVADQKRLVVELQEREGDRHLSLTVKERVLMKTRMFQKKNFYDN